MGRSLIQGSPDFGIFRCPFEIGCYLRDTGKLQDLKNLFLAGQLALHGTDLGRDSAVRKEISHIASLLSGFKEPVE